MSKYSIESKEQAVLLFDRIEVKNLTYPKQRNKKAENFLLSYLHIVQSPLQYFLAKSRLFLEIV